MRVRYGYERRPEMGNISYAERGIGAPSRCDKQINQVLRNIATAVINKNRHHVRSLRAL